MGVSSILYAPQSCIYTNRKWAASLRDYAYVCLTQPRKVLGSYPRSICRRSSPIFFGVYAMRRTLMITPTLSHNSCNTFSESTSLQTSINHFTTEIPAPTTSDAPQACRIFIIKFRVQIARTIWAAIFFTDYEALRKSTKICDPYVLSFPYLHLYLG